MTQAMVTTDWAALSVDELEDALARHNQSYWADDASTLDDAEFDRLVQTLRRRAPQSRALAEIGPAGAGVDLSAHLVDDRTISHDPPMLAFEACRDPAELARWFETFDGDAVASPNIAGVAASVRYDELGRLVVAARRGDGHQGRPITGCMLRLTNTLRTVDTHDIEVRGRVYLTKSDFQKHFADDFTAPRHVADTALDADHDVDMGDVRLRFAAEDVFGVEFESQLDKLCWLATLGFEVVSGDRIGRDKLDGGVRDLCGVYRQHDYPCEGVVYRALGAPAKRRLGQPTAGPMAIGCQTPTTTSSRRDQLDQLAHFADKMKLKGIGPKLVEQMYDTGLVREPADFFAVTRPKLIDLDRVGPALADTLMGRIEQRRRVDVADFLEALGIDQLGEHVAHLLADHFETLDAILACNRATLVDIPTIGEVIADRVTTGLRRQARQIATLRDCLRVVGDPKA